jgi:hypothetical protein
MSGESVEPSRGPCQYRVDEVLCGRCSRVPLELARGGGRASSKPNVSGFSSRGEQGSERTEDNGGEGEGGGAAGGRQRDCGRSRGEMWAGVRGQNRSRSPEQRRQRRLSSARAVLSVKAA